ATSATESSRVPARSNRPAAAGTGVSRTSRAMSTATSTPARPAPQNSIRQFVYWTTAAASGRPSAPPIPRDELIRAMAEPRRAGGTRERNALMPRGTIPKPAPWRARPTSIGARDDDSAHRNDPTMSGIVHTNSIRRAPYMSPRRPVTGVATAPASRVTVTTQDALDGLVPS